MGRRRWRFITIAAFLLFIKGSWCQDDSGFYYSPHVERNFAQVQPPLFQDSRPTSFFEHADSLRVPSRSSQTIYNEGAQIRFPSPNYDQNPSPFQLPTGRSQSGTQYYGNQPEYSGAQRPRLRQSLPHNYQFVYSTKKPETPQQIHSAAYQNDPSKPETFLGQITLDNPDTDYLQNTRFKNIPFDGNSLKINGQSGHITRDKYFDNENQDSFDQRVTTYNPNKINKQIISPKPSGSRFSHFEPPSSIRNINNSSFISTRILLPNHHMNSPLLPSKSYGSSTEYKALLDLEPLLQDDISDLSSLRELMKTNRNSNDVQVIKSKNLSEIIYDSKPDATYMTAGNAPMRLSKPESTTRRYSLTTEKTDLDSNKDKENHDDYSHNEEEDNNGDAYETYYDTEETEANKTTITEASTTSASRNSKEITMEPHEAEQSEDIYEEYDTTDEPEKFSDETTTSTESFDVLVMKHNKTLVKDDNFKQFVDTPVIDQIEPVLYEEKFNDNVNSSHSNLGKVPINKQSILGKEVVSVVTTKSVVNGTISIPYVTHTPATEQNNVITTTQTSITPPNLQNNDSSIPSTTESWLLASVQTSRSVSGARFLPFPTVELEDKTQVLADEDEDGEKSNEEFEPKQAQIDTDSASNSSISNEDINDKLDSIQSELSSAVLAGTLDKVNKNIELFSETNTNESTSTTTTLPLNVFTLKSTLPTVITEKSSPDPLPVMIKKFTPRVVSSTTPKPKRKSTLVTVMDDLSGLLPAGYTPRLSFKDKRTSTTPSKAVTLTSTIAPSSIKEDKQINLTQGRSSGISTKNKVILLDDKSLLPKEYKPKETQLQDEIFKNVQNDDISKLLPPGYKSSTLENANSARTTKFNSSRFTKEEVRNIFPSDYKSTAQSEIENNNAKKPDVAKFNTDDISKFLPSDYKQNTNETQKKSGVPKFVRDDASNLLPESYKPSAVEKSTEKDIKRPEIPKNFKDDDIQKFLPSGYKPTSNEPESKEINKLDIFKVVTDDIIKFLPPGYKPPAITNQTEQPKLTNSISPGPGDISALLPPGFKLNNTERVDETPVSFKVADLSKLLPPDFKLNETEDSIQVDTTTKSTSGIKLVFPSRPGGKLNRKTTPKSSAGLGPSPVTPKINKGWPVRASTEFTGWPSPSTTPFSIEKLLEAQRNATASSSFPIGWSTEATTRRTTSTTTTTPMPPPSTTPGICRKECEIAATIKIVGGVKWVPELQDPHTEEWKKLAKDIKEELNSIYSKSDLKKWYKNIHIDGFSKGSVLVDYFIELSDIEEKIDTLELKRLFHKSLTEVEPEPSKDAEIPSAVEINPDIMLGDQPEEERMKKSNEKLSKSLDKSARKLEFGKFMMDPAYTEFIVVQKREETKVVDEPEEESFLPQWGIAVIVIALASLLFVVIFGVTVLVNRQKNFKAKQPIPLSEDMLRELDKSHMGGFDDMHQMKERELPCLPPGKRMSTAFIEQLAYPNPGDSWRSEWTPQMQKYMQHYGADSGRGSQTYGQAGNIYGYSGSQYGQSGMGGGSQYGYTGEYPRSHHSRRRSEYDSNF